MSDYIRTQLKTKSQQSKVLEGYNLCVHNAHNNISDFGKTPVRGIKANGYELCRRAICAMQMEGVINAHSKIKKLESFEELLDILSK